MALEEQIVPIVQRAERLMWGQNRQKGRRNFFSSFR